MPEHSTATNGQFAQLTSSCNIALAQAIKDFPIKTLLSLFNSGQQLTELLIFVLNAWVNKTPLLMLKSDLKFNPWTSVKLGTKTAQELYQSLKKSRCKMHDWATTVLWDEYGYYQEEGKQPSIWSNLYKTATAPTKLNLVVVSLKELGFTEYPKRPSLLDIYDRAKNLGLELCPAEVGPTLLDQHPEINFGKWSYLYVAMNTILIPPPRGGNHGQGIFRIIDKKWLSMQEAWADSTFGEDDSFIFVSKDKKK